MSTKMNKVERMSMVKAMEFIARNLNDEEIFEGWLVYGVADGDIRYGDVAVNRDDEEMLDCYIQDEAFAELMQLFLSLMAKARNSGGLYCDHIVSKPRRGGKDNA